MKLIQKGYLRYHLVIKQNVRKYVWGQIFLQLRYISVYPFRIIRRHTMNTKCFENMKWYIYGSFYHSNSRKKGMSKVQVVI